MNCITFEFNADLTYEDKPISQILLHAYFCDEDFDKYEKLTLRAFNNSLLLKSITVNRHISVLNASMTCTLELYIEVDEHLVFTKTELTDDKTIVSSESTSTFKTDELYKHFNFELTPDFKEVESFMEIKCCNSTINNIININNNKC